MRVLLLTGLTALCLNDLREAAGDTESLDESRLFHVTEGDAIESLLRQILSEHGPFTADFAVPLIHLAAHPDMFTAHGKLREAFLRLSVAARADADLQKIVFRQIGVGDPDFNLRNYKK